MLCLQQFVGEYWISWGSILAGASDLDEMTVVLPTVRGLWSVGEVDQHCWCGWPWLGEGRERAVDFWWRKNDGSEGIRQWRRLWNLTEQRAMAMGGLDQAGWSSIGCSSLMVALTMGWSSSGGPAGCERVAGWESFPFSLFVFLCWFCYCSSFPNIPVLCVSF